MSQNKWWLFAVVSSALLFGACGSSVRGGSTDVAAIRGEGVDVWVEADESRLPLFNVEGKHYLLGAMGKEYQVWVANRTDRRLEIVVSVDGRDVISGKSADYRENRGYVLQPGEELEVEGFRKSLHSVAAFEFAGVEDSYADRMGDGSNVGVIGIAVFDEDDSYKYKKGMPIAAGEKRRHHYDRVESEDSSAAPPSSPSMSGAGGMAKSAPLDYEESAAPGLGTKYGDDVGSDAEIVPFKRRDKDSPIELMALYYDDREGLEALGIELPDEPTRSNLCDGPNPFPGVECDNDFAQPPPLRQID